MLGRDTAGPLEADANFDEVSTGAHRNELTVRVSPGWFCTVPSESVTEDVRARNVTSVTSVHWSFMELPRIKEKKLRMPRGCGGNGGRAAVPDVFPIYVMDSALLSSVGSQANMANWVQWSFKPWAGFALSKYLNVSNTQPGWEVWQGRPWWREA